jgi:regulator of replication initiation timing
MPCQGYDLDNRFETVRIEQSAFGSFKVTANELVDYHNRASVTSDEKTHILLELERLRQRLALLTNKELYEANISKALSSVEQADSSKRKSSASSKIALPNREPVFNKDGFREGELEGEV